MTTKRTEIIRKTEMPIWNKELIQKYDISGPRYTSYPTAPQLKKDFGEHQWQECVERSNAGQAPISLYFHIPFCDTICYYCGCNKIITANKKKAIPYINALCKEIDLQTQNINTNRPVKQIHFGGGTPTYLDDKQLGLLIAVIREKFILLSDTEIEFSIEVHPQSINTDRIKALRKLGFNRLSMGVQDFDTKVQHAVNRFNDETQVKELIQAARDCEFRSISIDLIYGLPKQTHQSFLRTIDKVIELDADRISLFNYAHMPHMFKSQKQIDPKDLPEPQEKLNILHDSIKKLTNTGYCFIGMDHFAKPEDELTLAQKNKTLQRNFQGYSTHKDCDLFSFGVSSIAAFGNSYVQNEKNIEDYYNHLNQDSLPISKGILVTKDDEIRRFVINALICNFELTINEVNTAFKVDFTEYFTTELQLLSALSKDGLVQLSQEKIIICPAGQLLVRRVCQVFDRYIKQHIPTQYSRII